ncbi:hypothetical protein KV580_12125 [Pseudomonas chlororaphis]|nr:hypothetical protein [Pseudomonas chlororaphis]
MDEEEAQNEPEYLKYFKRKQKINLRGRLHGGPVESERGELCGIDWTHRTLTYHGEFGLYNTVRFDEIYEIEPIAQYRTS